MKRLKHIFLLFWTWAAALAFESVWGETLKYDQSATDGQDGQNCGERLKKSGEDQQWGVASTRLSPFPFFFNHTFSLCRVSTNWEHGTRYPRLFPGILSSFVLPRRQHLSLILIYVLFHRCSDGFDRHRPEWLSSGCNSSGIRQVIFLHVSAAIIHLRV